MMKVDGSCHCGHIRYEAEVDPRKVSMCHCTDCQMLTGSAYRVSVPVPREFFRLLAGRPKTYVKTSESGTRRLHAFCPDCGAPVYSCAIDEPPPAYSLRVGCLRQRAELPPQKRIWCRSALDWSVDLSELPRHDRQ
jgi:hypothetical protein